MSETQVTVQGVIGPDGRLEVEQPLPLPAGRVQVTVQPLPSPTEQDRFWKMMEGIWADLRAAGHRPRTREEIDADLKALRDDAEEEMQAVERLHEQCRAANAIPRRQGE